MNDSPDVLEQVPAGGGMNKPASGTYGEKTELAQLQAELPIGDTAPQQAPSPTPPSSPPTRTGVGGGGGLPAGLLRPTTQPDVPVSTPLMGPPPDPMAGAVDARQRRLRLLDIMSTSPEVSPEMREWAEVVKRALIARG